MIHLAKFTITIVLVFASHYCYVNSKPNKTIDTIVHSHPKVFENCD